MHPVGFEITTSSELDWSHFAQKLPSKKKVAEGKIKGGI
jgi:hypothetical protein